MIVNQIIRATYSISSDLVKINSRSTKKEYLNFPQYYKEFITGIKIFLFIIKKSKIYKNRRI